MAALAVLVAVAPGVRAASSPVGGSSLSSDTPEREFLHRLDDVRLAGGREDLASIALDADSLAIQTGAERIFQGELVSVKAVATFSRGAETLEPIRRHVDPLLGARGGGRSPGSAGVTGADLSETIFALQSDSIASRAHDAPDGGIDGKSLFALGVVAGRAPRKAMQMFWEDDADFVYTGNRRVEVAAATASAGAGANVFIPLPAAAWSALSVLGGAGLAAGLRRLRLRLRQ